MKKIFLIVLLHFCFFGKSQIKSGKIVYKTFYNVKRATDELKQENIHLYQKYYNCEIIAHNLEFKLEFNDSISKFSSNDYLSSEEFDPIYERLTRSAFGYNDTYFTNSKKDSIFEYAMFYDGLRLLKHSSIDYEWTFHNESKIISGYTCYKATTTYKFYWNGKDREFPIIAWYCPEIPLKYSPLRYGGTLPGLVLELSETYKTWIATKIFINEKIENLQMPLNIEEFDAQKMELLIKEAKETK